MYPQNLYLAGQSRPLKPGPILAAGGEGTIYELGSNCVIKIFHQPHTISIQKLDLLVQRHAGGRLPPSVLGPRHIVVGRDQAPVGYVMPRLPAACVSLKQFCSIKWQQLNGISTPSLLRVFNLILNDLTRLHRAGVVVGDFNDLNLFIDGHNLHKIFWLDVDSFQIGQFPCPVAHPAFLDPLLYGETDLAVHAVFSPASDRYAFAVHLARALTGVHPYGGTHPRVKSLTDRATRQISFFDAQVKIPPFARPPLRLPTPIQKLMRQYFDQGLRPEIDLNIFGESTSERLPGKPVKSISGLTDANIQSLLGSDRELVTFHLISTGRWQAISYRPSDKAYSLCTGGQAAVISETPLFSGSAGIAFFFIPDGFGMWAPDGRQAFIFAFHPSGKPPILAATLPIEKGGPVLNDLPTAAATDGAFYRLTQGVILRGSLSAGDWVEEIIGTCHRHNSAIWGDPNSDFIAVLNQLWGEFKLWLRWPDGSITESQADATLWRRWASMSISDIERHLRHQKSLTPL